MLIAPMGAPLMGMLMLGNLMKESGVVSRLADVSSGALVNVVTLLLGLSVGASMLGGNFLQWRTILVFLLGLIAIAVNAGADAASQRGHRGVVAAEHHVGAHDTDAGPAPWRPASGACRGHPCARLR